MAREQILQNRKMVELDCHLPLPVPIEDLRIRPDYPRLIEVDGENTSSSRFCRKCATKRPEPGAPVQGELL